MVSKAFIIAAVVAYVEARFGQEQVPISAISAVQGGDAGAAATIAGAAISDLLGGANACAKLTRADQVFTELGGGADALAAAIGLVTAEKNTNPFANGNVQNVCGDASLPVTPELRGITPLIDPDVDVDGAAAALSQQTAASPAAADGLSVFDIMDQAGLGNLVASQSADGTAAAGGAAAQSGNQQADNNNDNGNDNANNQADNANNANDNQQADNQQDAGAGQDNAAADDNAAVDCNAGQNDAAADNQGNAADGQQDAAQGNNNNNNQQDAGNNNANATQNANNNNNQQGAAGGNDNVAAGGQAAAGDLAGADFGQCTPTITFQGGEGNRPADEFTFQIADELARGGQGEALNPNIITNALCNQLTNVCGANDAAITACEGAKAQVEAAGTRDKSTADLFNSALGFAGAVTNPDGGPENPPAAAGAVRRMRRGLRL